MINIFHCCGKTAKPVVKSIAFIDLMFAIGVTLAGLIIITYYPDVMMAQNNPDVTKLQNTPNIVTIILLAAFFFVEACLFTLLQSAVNNRESGQCDNWFKIRLILLCILIFGVIYWLTQTISVEEIYIAGGICMILVLYRVYTLMAIKSFYLEIVTSKQTDLRLETLRRIL